MGIRLYSLAKELRLDSRALVDLCIAAGVTGKGSALAMLTEKEEEQIRDYLRAEGTKSSKSGAKKRRKTGGSRRQKVEEPDRGSDEAPNPVTVFTTSIIAKLEPDNRALNVYLDPGDSPPELIAELYMALSAVYRSVGGSGLEIAKGQLGICVEDGVLR